MRTTINKSTGKKTIKRKKLCHDCLEDFMPKDLYPINKITHIVYVCLSCLKKLEPKNWKKIKKENDEWRAANKIKD